LEFSYFNFCVSFIQECYIKAQKFEVIDPFQNLSPTEMFEPAKHFPLKLIALALFNDTFTEQL
jgi:hypothetical protein